jgi:mannose-6-phosphate isomerase-like protein (cupin superfamily)
MEKVSLADKLEQIYKPKLVAEYNDNKIILTRARGEFVWHKHDDTGDCFLVLKGRLVIQLRDRDVVLDAGGCSSRRAASSTARVPTRRPRSS